MHDWMNDWVHDDDDEYAKNTCRNIHFELNLKNPIIKSINYKYLGGEYEKKSSLRLNGLKI